MSIAGTWQWFDEFEDGCTVELGSYQFTAQNIRSYASKFDPQGFHLNEEQARASPFGALCASGWHTAAGYMKCCAAFNFAGCDKAGAEGKTLPPLGPSPGFENMRWLKPVYAGDTVTYFNTVTSKRKMSSRSDWGLVFGRNTGVNQSGELVFQFDGKLLVARRP